MGAYTQEKLRLIRGRLERLQKELAQTMTDLVLLEQLEADKPDIKQVSPELAAVFPVSTANREIAAVVEEVVKPKLEINDEWNRVLELLNNGSSHVFVTGDAGTGKSTLLGHFVENSDKVIAIVAPTGVAALRVGGETIHRFFGFKMGMSEDDIQELSDTRAAKYKALEVLIIDEISMVRADMMDLIDKFLRKQRRKDIPFGGVRVVAFGDLFQLPPVAKDADEKKWLVSHYGVDTPYFFHASVWRQAELKTVALTTIFRQKDLAFTDALNAIRRGIAEPSHLELINGRVKPQFKPPVDDDLWLTLTTTNLAADKANQKMLESLTTPSKTFKAIVTGEFDLKNAPTDQELMLKSGATVMFIRNNKDGGWVNGTLGKVTEVEPVLKVMVNGEEHEVGSETWEQIAQEFDEKTRKLKKTVVGAFKQIPLKLAAAITIHKSQGLTFDKCIVDFANGAFAAGQAYVALSRCRTLEGMVLRRSVRQDDLLVSTEVQKFMAGEPIARPTTPVPQMALF